ncbi:hypothetical protein HMPREF1138_0889 [Actinomyces sp. ICM58]|nr:hypothetical protein HMPREF1138_0889 [Actinomyces sp. ICM58]
MHHMCPHARLRPPVRVARVLGRFPRLTRPGLDRAGEYGFWGRRGPAGRGAHAAIARLCRRRLTLVAEGR